MLPQHKAARTALSKIALEKGPKLCHYGVHGALYVWCASNCGWHRPPCGVAGHPVLSQSSIFGQNPKIWCQEFNDLQTPKCSKKQLCDRTSCGAFSNRCFRLILHEVWAR